MDPHTLYTAFSCLFHSLKEAGFHDFQYNYFYEWVLQSLLWLDNDIITTTVGPCLTSDQHRTSVLFLFMQSVCRCRNSLHCRCKRSSSVSFLGDILLLVDICHSFLPRTCMPPCLFRYIHPELSYTTLCTSPRSLMLIYIPDCRHCLWASVWCLMSICGHEFSLPSEAPIFLIPVSFSLPGVEKQAIDLRTSLFSPFSLSLSFKCSCVSCWEQILNILPNWDVRQILRFWINPHLSAQKDVLGLTISPEHHNEPHCFNFH